MKAPESEGRSMAGGREDASEFLERSSSLERADPIPLDVLASEMRRQSELLIEEDKSYLLDSVYDAVSFGADGASINAGTAAEAMAASARSAEQIDALEKNTDLLSATNRESKKQMGEYATAEDDFMSLKGKASPRKTSDVLTDRLIHLRQRAELAERQHQELLVAHRQLKARMEALEQRNAQLDEGGQAQDALRQELEQVRQAAAKDLHSLREQLQASVDDADNARNVELEAELQALRQESAALRNSAKKKDAILEDLAAQCRGLEDQIEDRDREMERLHRDLSGPKRGDAVQPADMAESPMADLDLDSLFSVQDKPNSKMLEGAGLVFMPDGPRPKLALGLVAALGLLVGLALVEVALLFSGQPELLSQLMGGDQAEQVATPVAPQAALVAESPPPASEQPPTPAAATPSASKMSAVAAPLVKAAPAAAPSAASDALRGGGEGPLMVALPGGSFVMGSKRNTLAKDEQPAHLVDLPPFRISRYEVTFAQYDRFARATGRALPSDAGWGRGERPVINVSWDDAQAYVRWLSQQTGERYRLPSEAQWEYAARAGGESRYWWGFASEQGRAVCFDCGSAWDKRRTAPVGSLPANPFSLHDTAGNAMEWVEDCHHSNYQGAPTNGEAWLNGDCSQRMVRGGAFNKPLSSLRSAARYQLPQDARFNMLGFRVVRD